MGRIHWVWRAGGVWGRAEAAEVVLGRGGKPEAGCPGPMYLDNTTRLMLEVKKHYEMFTWEIFLSQCNCRRATTLLATKGTNEGDKRSAQGRPDFDLFDTRGTITPPAVTKHSLWNLFVCVHFHLWLGRRLYLGQHNVFKDVPVCLRVDGQC